ncbi:MAG: 23S rRNA (adenine(2503)-C(2))-methyltransferase RlmN [Candidatus Omnitrophica bacterium]|nr:23S rRNA (adenine(2503)-C(2))-methyltransferase RlmN [Candidatus Omnitrophota bacterium]
MDKHDILNFTPEEFKEKMREIKELPYRAAQVFSWIYKKGVRDFIAMENIPAPLKDKLSALYCIGNVSLAHSVRSSDDSEKFLFKLYDANYIESVLIPAKDRRTLCLSTQVGCKYNCLFCASGSQGFKRNLSAGEIISQILFIQEKFKDKITNFVFMGMGEPFDNYENFKKAVKIMNDKDALNIASRRITVSTSGVIPAIEDFKKLGLQVNLSVSLHAANDKLRSALMPINKKYPLEKLIKVCEDFFETTKRKITLEYILIRGVNDSLKDAGDLAKIARRLKAKVNLIAYSSICRGDLAAPERQVIDTFIKALMRYRVNVILRESKGKDIQAACGQLALMHSENH